MKKIISITITILILSVLVYFNQDRTKVHVKIRLSDKLKTQYTYYKNKLIKITSPKQTIHYTLDEFDRRITKKINERIIEQYVWLEDNKLLAILDDKQNIKQQYLYKNQNDSLPYGMTQGSQTYYFIYNKMKSLKVVVDKKKKVVKVLQYDEKGNLTLDSNPKLSIAIGYAGGLYDKDSELLHFKEGIYSPTLSKWLTKINDHDIIQNLKQLNATNENDVYQCNATLDVYYHSYLCAGKQCGGLYANDYMNYLNGTGEIIDNSNYFNKNICTKVEPTYKNSNKHTFARCVNKKIQSRVAKLFDALSYNCHDEVENIIETCSKLALTKGTL